MAKHNKKKVKNILDLCSVIFHGGFQKKTEVYMYIHRFLFLHFAIETLFYVHGNRIIQNTCNI